MHFIRYVRLALLASGGLLLSNFAHALGTAANDPVTNSVTLDYTVNSVSQSSTTAVTFNVDRKLIIDVTTTDSGWVTAVPGQDPTTGGAVLPALNFTVTNNSNDATNVVLGLIDQDGTAVTAFSTVGTAFGTAPTSVVVAIDTNGNSTYDQGVDTVLVANGNGVYPLGSMAADATTDIVVAIDVDSAEPADRYRSYTLVAALADGSNVPLQLDDSGNIAPASGATPSDVANGLTTVENVWADAGSANAEDEQFDFFSAASGLGTADAVADGQSADASGFVVRVTLSLAKFVQVLYDPISGNRFNAAGATIAEAKAIPGAVLMYVIGVVNESATLTANAVGLTDTLPGSVTAGDQANPGTAIEVPDSVSFAVGGATPSFDLSSVSDLDIVSFSACSAPTSAPAYNGPPVTQVAGDVGDCGPSDTAYVVYFVTLD